MLNLPPRHTLTHTENLSNQWEKELQFLVAGIAAQIGEAFFQACARYLAQSLGVKYGFITEFVSGENPKARVLAFWAGEEFGANFEYDLAGTPCGAVYEENLRIYPQFIQNLFPDDEDLVSLQAQSYLGMAILDIHGNPIGHIAALHTQPLEKSSYEYEEAILKIFAARSAAEIERMSAEQKLKDQNIYLEATLKKLQQTQAQLIQSEKMSSLGTLVAGIAHEVNNPISFIHSNIDHTKEYVDTFIEVITAYQEEYPHNPPLLAEKVNISELEFRKDDIYKILNSMKSGSDRIRDFVLKLRNFSRLNEANQKFVDLHEGLENTLLMLEYRIYDHQIKIVKDYGKLSQVYCYPSQLNQVFLNIINNAIDAVKPHSKSESQPAIYLTTEMIDDQDAVRISITDNGIGIDQKTLAHIFDPFFTTKPVGSGTGLGLAISYQIIVEQHRGKLNCISSLGEYTKFIIEIPTLGVAKQLFS